MTHRNSLLILSVIYFTNLKSGILISNVIQEELNVAKIANKLPEILLAALIAIPAWFIGKTFPIIGSPVLGILFGMILAFWKKPHAFDDRKDRI